MTKETATDRAEHGTGYPDLDPILLARKTYMGGLPYPREYRVGKYSAIGPGKGGRETIFRLQGSGVLKRLWTTHETGTHLRMFVYVDGERTPLLHGFTHEIGRAASRIRCPEIPLGGFHDGRSTSLYLPIQFDRSIQIDVEPDGDVGDGPYYQIDYVQDSQERWPRLRQAQEDGRLTLSYDFGPAAAPQEPRALQTMEEEFELFYADPHNLFLSGPAVVRRVEITCANLDSLLLRVSYDDAVQDGDRPDGPWQVAAPIRYLVSDFCSSGVERLGTTAILHFPMPFRRRLALQLLVGQEYGTFEQKHQVKVLVAYEQDPADIGRMFYFHARFASATTNGYEPLECLNTSGRGHFVGLHVFDTGHDHGGADSIVFDGRTEQAGQLKGICGEDYFHMAYMRVWNRSPYSGCPTHSRRYRHHLELPVPFRESFVFNWGSFAEQAAKAVAFWYQEKPWSREASASLEWRVTGPFALDQIDKLRPGADAPKKARAGLDGSLFDVKSWVQRSQQCFLELNYTHRRYHSSVPPSNGATLQDVCERASTRLYAVRDTRVEMLVGCDDPIRVFVNGDQVLRDEGRTELSPFKVFRKGATLRAGVNEIVVAVGTTRNTNMRWNGFSFSVRGDPGVEIIPMAP